MEFSKGHRNAMMIQELSPNRDIRCFKITFTPEIEIRLLGPCTLSAALEREASGDKTGTKFDSEVALVVSA